MADPSLRARVSAGRADGEELVGHLQSALTEQQALLDRDDPNALQLAGQRVSWLLERIAAVLPGLSARSAERLHELHNAHRTICLKLALQKREAAEHLARIRKTKPALRAYRRR